MTKSRKHGKEKEQKVIQINKLNKIKLIKRKITDLVMDNISEPQYSHFSKHPFGDRSAEELVAHIWRLTIT